MKDYEKHMKQDELHHSSEIVRGFEHQYGVTPELSFFEKLLKEWANLNQVIRVQTDSNFNWLNEGANLGVLASAVWKCGGVAIEEYSVAPKVGNKYRSNVDLFFKYEQKTLLCEAKHYWIRLPSKKKINPIDDLLKFAYKDIHKSLSKPENKCDIGLAITFFTPFWEGSGAQPQANVDELKEQLKELKCDFYSYLECTGFEPMKDSSKLNYASILIIGKKYDRIKGTPDGG